MYNIVASSSAHEDDVQDPNKVFDEEDIVYTEHEDEDDGSEEVKEDSDDNKIIEQDVDPRK